jgi:hypothetical protein
VLLQSGHRSARSYIQSFSQSLVRKLFKIIQSGSRNYDRGEFRKRITQV